MEKTTLTKGFILKDIIQYDDHSVVLHHKKFQCPISFSPFGWIGFIGQEDNEIVFDEDLHYYINTGKILGRKTLYLSHSDRYETLPTTEQELSSDDKDDFTMLQLDDKTDEDIEPTKELVEVGSVISAKKEIDKDYDADLYLKTETIQLRLGSQYIDSIMSYLKASPAHELITAKVGSTFTLNQQLLAYDDDWAFHVMPKCFFDSEIDSTPIHYMAFFLEKKPLLWGENGLYCGYHRQINIKHLSASVLKEFSTWCRARAPRLTAKGENYTSSIIANPFNLWRWLHPDELSITDDALVYTRKTFKRDEMIYLPFKRISLFLSTSGFLSSSFEVYGEQNIIPKFSFSAASVSAIKKALVNHQVRTGVGRSWHSTYLFPKNWFGRAPRILNVDNKLIFYPKRIESEMKRYFNMKTRAGALEKLEISEVTWHKPILNWYGTIEIKGTPKNIREDQHEKTVTMIVPNLSMFCYKFLFFFSGSLRDFLKQSNAKFERKYKKYNFG